MLLVGDSLGMCVYGYSETIPVTMDQCIYHSEAVRRDAPNTFIVGDMPFMSYQSALEKAVENAGRFLKEAGSDAIKLEGGVRIVPQIKAIIEADILVMGHFGLTPQSSGQLGGHKAQGRTLETARFVIEDAVVVQEAGAQMILLEAIPPIRLLGRVPFKIDYSSSIIATGLAHPALAPLILIGKQQTVNPCGLPIADRLANFSI
jgi:3-methyl-2-oxobutanoate hydroxymethyltransferase